MRGPAPTPTEILNARGSPRAKRRKNEPVAPSGRPDCPAHVTGEARREWDRISGDLEKLGLLATTDRAALAAYCILYRDWAKAQKKLDREGMTYKRDGLIKVNPLVRIVKDLSAMMLAYIQQFGLTPASRARVQTHPKDQPKAKPVADDEPLLRIAQ